MFFVIFLQSNHHTFSGQQHLIEIMDFPILKACNPFLFSLCFARAIQSFSPS